MKEKGILVLGLAVLALIAYAVFVIAVIKLVVGAIILLITVPVLWFLWKKVKKKAEDKF
ncbi:hypothetical protein [Christiangramia flava]|uniref:Uncharacterized protein n=1 Tax=Christiangramia flava JLT2011 TaxID=1229726 RepID=A0A1L7I3S6_9FLAO|nr:hypothetical protein [Christiangramia flava]APU68258.1 hypothetical protein GRFL_1534 [Christiangramia flava JLT2011]OSS40955.1 hypothetical protein C723_0364 [Christiangramia flava JLT2011]